MPLPRLTLSGALRAGGGKGINLFRPLSTTASLGARDDAAGPSSSPSSSSSTSRLLSLANDRTRHHQHRQQIQPQQKHQQQNQQPTHGKPSGSGSSSGNEAADRLLGRYRHNLRSEAAARARQAQVEYLRESRASADYLRQMPRHWRAGAVYSPHDLSATEMLKWRKRSHPDMDVVDALGLEPLDMYRNFSMISEFTLSSGQIKNARSTCLRPVNQRKIAKMVRRAQGMGLYPTIHRHPELLRSPFFPHTR